ncbi:DUF5081 family protein [Enterococcus sp. LJL128]|uniref:DUF5081 family protein n=1 Tax=Enterococcus sp. LJL51 TaxID=3416656 RepID=UPI003CF410E5
MLLTKEALLILTDTVGHDELFGFPDLTFYRMNQKQFHQQGLKELRRHQLLDEEEQLTDEGFFLALLVEKYGDAEQYISIGNRYFIALLEECILLEKTETGYLFQLFRPEELLSYLYVHFTIFAREPLEEEAGFRSRRARIDLTELEQEDISHLLPIGSIERTETEIKKVEFVLFISDGLLYRLQEGKLKRISQYWLTKWLVDRLGITYELEDETRKRGLSNW